MLNARYIWFSLLLTLSTTTSAPYAAASAPHGLRLGTNGTVLRLGQPYRGIGVNYFDPFLRLLHDPADTSFDHGFRVLAEHKIPFARFAATGFWPRDMGLYLTNRAEYFRRLDLVVRSAEKHGVGLIPSLFWHHPLLPDLAGEPMEQWGNPQSQTHARMRTYVREIVGRYRSSPAIWAWEFGNEFNLACDLPNAAQHRPAIHPGLGTPESRSPRDDLTYDHVVVALREFGSEIRKLDLYRLITSGHSIIRPSAWHNRAEKTWKTDSPEQFLEMFRLTHPEPIDLLSVHCYDDDFQRVEDCARAASRLQTPLFIGEFQVPHSADPKGQAALESFLHSLDRHRVPLAAIWVFDLASQEKDFSITPTNARAWQLPVLRSWNEKWSRPDLASAPNPSQFLVFNLSRTAPAEAVTAIKSEFPAGTDPNAPIRIGMAAIFSYLAHPRATVEQRLREFLRLSEQHDMPIVVQLDGENWWQARPDLWNWWNPAAPGYSPSNRFNVEWSSWSPDDALKIAWRNWGRQLRVLPPPNLMSPAYRAACHDEMRHFVPIILDWWHQLPQTKKDLLIGIKLGWESSIGVNAWYYPHGNDLLNKPASEDPNHGLKAEEVPARGVTRIGYAAVTSAKLRSSGDVTEADLARVVHLHLEDLCRLAAELGVPRDRLFTHAAGWKDGELLYGTAVNPHSCPGWSFYRHAAAPDNDAGVQSALKTSDAPYWAAVEWLFQGRNEPDAWQAALQRTFNQPRCRYLCIYNWEPIPGNKAAVQGISKLLSTYRPFKPQPGI